MELGFGAYAQVSVEGNNTMRPRTVGCVALRPSSNSQGGARFLSLETGRVISARTWRTLPVTRDVVDRVHQLARRAKASRMMGLERVVDDGVRNNTADGGEARFDPVYDMGDDSDEYSKASDDLSSDSTYVESVTANEVESKNSVDGSGDEEVEDHRSGEA